MMDMIYLKIETIPIEKELENGSEQYQMYKQTYEQSREIISERDLQRSYMEEAGKSPAYGKISAIALAFVNNDEIRCKIYRGEEKHIVQALYRSISTHFKDASLYGWGFDFMKGFLQLRTVVNGIVDKPSQISEIINAKPWSRKRTVDMFDHYVNPGWNKIGFVQTLSMFGLKYDDIVDGRDIAGIFHSGEVNKLNASLQQTVKGMVNIHRKFEGLDVLDNITTDVEVVEEVKKEKRPLIDVIVEKGTLSSRDIELIGDYVEKENLDRENAIKIVRAGLSKEQKDVDKYEPLQQLRDRLLGKVDTTGFSCVVDKNNMGKTELKQILRDNKDKSGEEKKAILENLYKFLEGKNKINQARCKGAYEMLEQEWTKEK